MTYKELKNLLDNLSEEELNQEAVVCDEEECHPLKHAEMFSEDYFYNDEDRDMGIFPLSEFTENPDEPMELKLAFKKDTLILHF